MYKTHLLFVVSWVLERPPVGRVGVVGPEFRTFLFDSKEVLGYLPQAFLVGRCLPLCEADTGEVVSGNKGFNLGCEGSLEGDILLFPSVPVTKRLAKLGETGDVASLCLEDSFTCLGWLLGASCLVHGIGVADVQKNGNSIYSREQWTMRVKHEDSPYVSAQPTMQGIVPEGIERNGKGKDRENRKCWTEVESSQNLLVVLVELAACTPCKL